MEKIVFLIGELAPRVDRGPSGDGPSNKTIILFMGVMSLFSLE